MDEKHARELAREVSREHREERASQQQNSNGLQVQEDARRVLDDAGGAWVEKDSSRY